MASNMEGICWCFQWHFVFHVRLFVLCIRMIHRSRAYWHGCGYEQPKYHFLSYRVRASCLAEDGICFIYYDRRAKGARSSWARRGVAKGVFHYMYTWLVNWKENMNYWRMWLICRALLQLWTVFSLVRNAFWIKGVLFFSLESWRWCIVRWGEDQSVSALM